MNRQRFLLAACGFVGAKAVAQSVYGGGSPAAGTPRFADSEVPTGTIDGTNNIFVLRFTPFPTGSIQLFRNGQMQYMGPTSDYSLLSNVVTFASAAIPQPGDSLIAWYRY